MINCNCKPTKKPTYNPCTHSLSSASDFYNKEEIETILKRFEIIKSNIAIEITKIFEGDILNLTEINKRLEYIERLLGHDSYSTIVLNALEWLQGFSDGRYPYDLNVIGNYIKALTVMSEDVTSKFQELGKKLLDVFKSLQEKVTFEGQESILIEMLQKYLEVVEDEETREIVTNLIKDLKDIQNGKKTWNDIDLKALYDILNKIKKTNIYFDYRQFFEDNSKKFEYYTVVVGGGTSVTKTFDIDEILYYDDGVDLSSLDDIKELSNSDWRTNIPSVEVKAIRYIWKRIKYVFTEIENGETKNTYKYDYSWFSILPEGVTSTLTKYYLLSDDEDDDGNPIQPAEDADWVTDYPKSPDKYSYLWTKEVESYEGIEHEPSVNYHWIPLKYVNVNIPDDAKDGQIYYKDTVSYYQTNNLNHTADGLNADVTIQWSDVHPKPLAGYVIWKKIIRVYYTYHASGNESFVDISTDTWYEAIYTPKDGETPNVTIKYYYTDDNIHVPSNDLFTLTEPQKNNKLYVWTLQIYSYTNENGEEVYTNTQKLCLPNTVIHGINGRDGVTMILHDGIIEERYTSYYKTSNSTLPSQAEIEALTNDDWSNVYPGIDSTGVWVITRIVSEYYKVDNSGNKGEYLETTVNYTPQYIPNDGDTISTKESFAITKDETQPEEFPYSTQPTADTIENWDEYKYIWHKTVYSINGVERNPSIVHWRIDVSSPTTPIPPIPPAVSDWVNLRDYFKQTGIVSYYVSSLNEVISGKKSWIDIGKANGKSYIEGIVNNIPNTNDSWCVNTRSYLNGVISILDSMDDIRTKTIVIREEVDNGTYYNIVYEEPKEPDISDLMKKEDLVDWEQQFEKYINSIVVTECDCDCHEAMAELRGEMGSCAENVQSKMQELIDKINVPTQAVQYFQTNVPFYSFVPYLRQPFYTNIEVDAGVNWFPLGWVSVVNIVNINSEINKWNTRYPDKITFQIDEENSRFRISSIRLKNNSTFTFPNIEEGSALGFQKVDLWSFNQAKTIGSNEVTLTTDNLPAHRHDGKSIDNEKYTYDELDTKENLQYSGYHSHDLVLPVRGSAFVNDSTVTRLTVPSHYDKDENNYTTNVNDTKVTFFGKDNKNALHNKQYRNLTFAQLSGQGGMAESLIQENTEGYSNVDGVVVLPGGSAFENTKVTGTYKSNQKLGKSDIVIGQSLLNNTVQGIDVGVLKEPSGHQHRHFHTPIGKGEAFTIQPKTFTPTYLIRLEVVSEETGNTTIDNILQRLIVSENKLTVLENKLAQAEQENESQENE